MCYKCYTINGGEIDLRPNVDCQLRDRLYFSNECCMTQHYHNRIFMNWKGNKRLPPCLYFRYCINCDKVVKLYSFKTDKADFHNCNKIYCSSCAVYDKIPHYSYIKPLLPLKKSSDEFPCIFL